MHSNFCCSSTPNAIIAFSIPPSLPMHTHIYYVYFKSKEAIFEFIQARASIWRQIDVCSVFEKQSCSKPYHPYKCVSIESYRIESNIYTYISAHSQADIPVCRSQSMFEIFQKLIGNCGIGDEQRAFVE